MTLTAQIILGAVGLFSSGVALGLYYHGALQNTSKGRAMGLTDTDFVDTDFTRRPPAPPELPSPISQTQNPLGGGG